MSLPFCLHNYWKTSKHFQRLLNEWGYCKVFRRVPTENFRGSDRGWKEWKILALVLTLCNHWVSLYQHPLPPLSLTCFSPLCLWRDWKAPEPTELVSRETSIHLVHLEHVSPLLLIRLAKSPRSWEVPSTRCFLFTLVLPSLAWQTAELFCFYKPYYITKILNSDAEPT